MSYQRPNDPASSVNLNVNEIAAILRHVQSGQLTLQQQHQLQVQQQQQQQQHVSIDSGVNAGSSLNQQGLRNNFEGDPALSLIQNVDSNKSNYGLFSQPLRRPGRAPSQQQQQLGDATLSKGALQKQIFATRLMGTTSTGVAQSSNTAKPNIGASRSAPAAGFGIPPPGMPGSGPPPSLMGTSSIGQQQTSIRPPAPPTSAAAVSRPGMQGAMYAAFQKNVPPPVIGKPGNMWPQGRNNPYATPNMGNSPYGTSNIGNQSSPSLSQTSSPQLSSSSPHLSSPQINPSASASPLQYSQDIDFRGSPYSHSSSPSTSMMTPAIRPGGSASSTNFQSTAVTPSTSNYSGVTTASSFRGGFRQGGVGGMTQGGVGRMTQGGGTSGSSYKQWQQGTEADVRKRKLEDELAQFEMQVGPPKQRRSTTGHDQNENSPYLGGFSSGGAGDGKSSQPGGGDASDGSPYQWSTNFVHPADEIEEEREKGGEDRGNYEEIDVEGWIDSLVTYKKPEEAEQDAQQRRGASSERRDGKRSSRDDRRRRRSASPPRRKSRFEPDDRKGSAGRDRQRSPARQRSLPRTSADREDRNRRSPLHKRADRSPRNEERMPRQERRSRSPRRESGQRSPSSSRLGRSPRRDRNKEDGSERRGDGRSTSGRDAKRTNLAESDRKGNQSVQDKMAEEDKKKDQTSTARDIYVESEAAGQSRPGLLQKRNAVDESKSIKINLKFQKGKDGARIGEMLPLSATYSSHKDKADKKNQKGRSDNYLAKNVGDDSIRHQISLFTKLDMDSFVKKKQLVDCFCYLCQMPCNDLKGYLNHVIDRKHKDNVAKANTSSGKLLFIKYLKTLPDLPDPGKKTPAKSNAATTKEAEKPAQKTCYECRQTYTGNLHDHLRSSLHQQNAHKTSRNHCSTCDMKFPNYQELKRHFHSDAHIKNAQAKLENIGKPPKPKDDKIGKPPKPKDDKIGKPPKPQDDNKVGQQLDTIEEPAARTKNGMELIIPVFGYFCRACTKFYNGDKVTREEHSVNMVHLRNVKIYYTKVKQAEEETNASKATEIEKEVQHTKQECTSSDLAKTMTKAVQDDSPKISNDAAIGSINLKSTQGIAAASKIDRVVDLTESDDVIEVDDMDKNKMEAPQVNDGKCARCRVYLRKTKKINTDSIKTAAKTVTSDIESQLAPQVKSHDQTQVKGQNGELGEDEKSSTDKSENETSVKSTSKEIQSGKAMGQNAHGVEGKKQESDKTNAKDSDSEKKRISRSTSKSRSEASRDGRKSDRSSDERKDRSSSRSRYHKDDARSSRTDRDKSTPSRENKLSRSAEIRNGNDRDSWRSSSRGKEMSSRRSRERSERRGNERREGSDRDSRRSSSRGKERQGRERSERRRSPPRSRGDRRGDSRRDDSRRDDSRRDGSRRRPESSRRSGSSGEDRSGPSRRDNNKRQEKGSEVPSMDDMVAIDEVGGSDEYIEELGGSDEEGEVDENAMEAMMGAMMGGNMGSDWQVVSEDQ